VAAGRCLLLKNRLAPMLSPREVDTDEGASEKSDAPSGNH